MKTIHKTFTYIALISSLLVFQSCAFLRAAAEQGEKFDPFNLTNEYVFPETYFGASAGIGFESDFEETSLCLGAEYLWRLSDEEKDAGFYAGPTVNWENVNFDDNKWNVFKAGAKAEWHFPITRSRETSFILGARATYDFGSQEFGGFKDDISGYQASLFSGLNIRYSETLSFGLNFNVLSHLDYTFKSDQGDFESDFQDTQLLLNKHNPAMLYVRLSPRITPE